MTAYDAVMIGMIVAGMVWGAFKGIVWQLASILSLVMGYTVAHQLSAQVAPYMPGEPVVQRAVAMIAVYVLTSGGIFFGAWMIRSTLQRMKFEAYDRHLGMLLGGTEGALLGIVGTLFVVSLAPATRGPIFSSPTGKVGRHVHVGGGSGVAGGSADGARAVLEWRRLRRRRKPTRRLLRPRNRSAACCRRTRLSSPRP